MVELGTASSSQASKQLIPKPMLSINVVCPEGVSSGELLHIEHEGHAFDVEVPDGVLPGSMFAVEYEAPAGEPVPAHAGGSEPISEAPANGGEGDTEAAEPSDSRPNAVPGASQDASLLMQAVAQKRLSPENAQALHDIMEALYDFGAHALEPRATHRTATCCRHRRGSRVQTSSTST